MKSGNRKQLFNEINITPLTDIFLVLLIIMMVVAPMLNTSGLKVAVPSAAPSPDTKDEPKTINININASGQYSIDGKTINPMSLATQIQTEKGSKPDGVIIKTNPEASHEALTTAMDAAQMAGITKVAVMADEGGATGSPDGQ